MTIVLVALTSLTAIDAGSAADCADCDGDGSVAISELVTGVSVALGRAAVSVCPAIDRDGDGAVTIDELVGAVAEALNGCPATPGPEPSVTPSGAATAPATTTASPTASATLPPADNPSPTATPTAPGGQVPPTEAAALLTWLQAGSYLDWQAESAPHVGTGPHFGVVRTFVNDALFTSLSGTAAHEHPAQSAAVKELYGNSGSSVRGWAVMVKIQDDSDLGRGWYWYEFFGSSGGGSIGNPGCTGCHASGRDYVRIPFPLQ